MSRNIVESLRVGAERTLLQLFPFGLKSVSDAFEMNGDKIPPRRLLNQVRYAESVLMKTQACSLSGDSVTYFLESITSQTGDSSVTSLSIHSS